MLIKITSSLGLHLVVSDCGSLTQQSLNYRGLLSCHLLKGTKLQLIRCRQIRILGQQDEHIGRSVVRWQEVMNM